MKWYVWLILFISVSLILGLFQKLKNERLIEEGPIETKVDISKLKPIDYPDIPITPQCTPEIKYEHSTTTEILYYTDPKTQEKLATCIGEVARLEGELKAWKDNYFICQNTQ